MANGKSNEPVVSRKRSCPTRTSLHEVAQHGVDGAKTCLHGIVILMCDFGER